MKKLLFTFIFLLTISSVSAEIILTEPDDLYNLGDVVSIPAIIKTNSGISDFLTMNLICAGTEKEFYKEYILLSSGEEKKITPSIILIPETIGKLSGNCKVKAIINEDFYLTKEFTISNKITLTIQTQEKTQKPGTSFFVEGEAIKENQKYSDGLIELEFPSIEKKYTESINNGYFSFNISLPEDFPAGEHTLILNAYETDKNQEQTNKGLANYALTIEQIPKNLEIFIENPDVEPGTNLKVKTLLRDQSGENIPATSIITIKNEKGRIQEQIDLQTDEFLEYPIEYSEPSSTWQIHAVSTKMETDLEFTIQEKQEIEVTRINNTLLIKNIGNVIYDKPLTIKIGEESITLDLELGVEDEEKYSLQAPDGEYELEIIADNQNKFSDTVFLTGNAINIDKVSSGVIQIIRYPFVWIFIIGVFGFVGYMVVRKGYQRTFIGKIHLPKFKRKLKKSEQENLIDTENKAELSLSIKGEKQNSSVICMKIKNKKHLQEKKQNLGETIKKIKQIAENNKASIYETNDYLFIILAPVNTKTFKNQKKAVQIAQQIYKYLEAHNKLLKEKIDFGISVNDGEMIVKKEKGEIKFMPLANLLGNSKKVSGLAEKTVLLTKNINEKLRSDVKTEKKEIKGTEVFTIKEIKKKDHETEKFIGNFIKRMKEEDSKK